jgi:hypothetical protein
MVVGTVPGVGQAQDECGVISECMAGGETRLGGYRGKA